MARPKDDTVGELQDHIRVYSKAVADTIWELQQMRAPDMGKVDGLAAQLTALADRLDGPGGLIDSLPDFPRDANVVKQRLADLRKEHDHLEPQLIEVLKKTEAQQAALRESLVHATRHLIGEGQQDAREPHR